MPLKHTKELAERVYQVAQTDPVGLCTDAFKKSAIQDHITWHVTDILSVIHNINHTSVNAQDKRERLMELEEKTGIPGICEKFK